MLSFSAISGWRGSPIYCRHSANCWSGFLQHVIRCKSNVLSAHSIKAHRNSLMSNEASVKVRLGLTNSRAACWVTTMHTRPPAKFDAGCWEATPKYSYSVGNKTYISGPDRPAYRNLNLVTYQTSTNQILRTWCKALQLACINFLLLWQYLIDM